MPGQAGVYVLTSADPRNKAVKNIISPILKADHGISFTPTTAKNKSDLFAKFPGAMKAHIRYNSLITPIKTVLYYIK